MFDKNGLTDVLDRLQKENEEWRRKNYPKAEDYYSLLGLMEELGELAHADLKGRQGIREGTDTRKILALKVDAIGDIVIYLADYCNQQGIHLRAAVLSVWDRVKQRNWMMNKLDGENIGVRTVDVEEEKTQTPLPYTSPLAQSLQPTCSPSPSPSFQSIVKAFSNLATCRDGKLDADFIAHIMDLYVLFCKKHTDYGPSNISLYKETGVLMRMSDKLMRLRTLLLEDITPENESVEDSFRDIAIYAIIALLLRAGQWPKGKVT